MNRFRSRKKSFHDDPFRRPSAESDVPALPKFSSKTFKRNKKSQPEAKPQVDLTNALPSSNDFRTSLLMPNLSARFSMLREQDDPRSKLGKANDDSVLFPKRASRLDLFNTGGLRDVSQDDSIRAPIRPPFANTRTESYGSDGSSWTDDGHSMISRARPGEGNTLFGGRQKIYKIPVGPSGSTKNFGGDEHVPRGGMGGKALYGDDIDLSTFPNGDTHANEIQDAERDDQRTSSDERSNSPPFNQYNRNRETASSTNSGPSGARTSTAATSVASQRSVNGAHGPTGIPHAMQVPSHSQAPDRPVQKSRRLYGQGLDQHIYDQQHSAMNRLESLHRQRTNGAPSLARLQGSRSATNLNDRFQRSGPMNTSNEFGVASPPPSGPPSRMAEFDLGLTPELSEHHGRSGVGRSPPLSPPMSPVQDQTFLASLEPNDLGKATASGAFNKPSKQYSEQQYLQRQLKLQQGRESPSLIRPFSPSAASIDEHVATRARDNSLAGPQPHAGSPLRARERSLSNLQQAHFAESEHPAFRNPEEQCHPTTDSSFLSHMSSEVGSPVDSDNEPDLFPPSASYPSPKIDGPPHQAHKQAPRKGEPFRHLQANNHHVKRSEESSSDSRSEITITELDSATVPNGLPTHVDADSPTLPPTTLNGLNGLVRAHLRNDSGQSSIYPEPSPGLHSTSAGDAHNLARDDNQAAVAEPGTFFRVSTIESEAQQDESPSDMPPPLSLRARQILNQATVLRDTSLKVQQMRGDNKAQR
ncbi:MAG: hypothetical protein Q9211_003929, partial [Gyalolechia sp. 1 TL-2023]